MTYIEIAEIVAGVFACIVLLDIVLHFWKKHLEEKMERERKQNSLLHKINDTLEMNIKNSYEGNSSSIIMQIMSVNRTAEDEHNIREIERLNKLRDKLKELIKPTDDVVDKIQRTRRLASKEMKNKHKLLMLQIICYGFIIEEEWEIVEGIKLAFNDAGVSFRAPANIEECNELYEQYFFKELK